MFVLIVFAQLFRSLPNPIPLSTLVGRREGTARPFARSQNQNTLCQASLTYTHPAMSKLTEEQVTEYLRNHPEFLLNWLGENSSTELVDVFGRLARDRCVDSSVPDTSVGTCRSDTRSSLPNFTQVSRNSITSSIFRRYVDGDRTRKTSLRKDRNSLRTMSEDELFMELIRDIASELDVNLLCHKILQNVSLLTNSDRSSLFLVRGSREGKYLVSKLFDVTVTSTLEDSQNNEIKVPFGKGIVGIVAQTGVAINIKDAYAVSRLLTASYSLTLVSVMMCLF